MLEALSKKSILILGFGREGRDTLSFLRLRFPKKRIGVADKKDKKIKNNKNLNLFFGDDYLKAVEKYELIIKSPGIPFSKIKKYGQKKIITSQTDIFLKINRDRVVGITGTKGKTTTATLIYDILKKRGIKAHLLGNMGNPVLGYLDKEGIFIYELSSFQLQTTKSSPKIAIFLNLFTDHLDHHQSFSEYSEAKKNIFRYQKYSDQLIYNGEDKSILKLIKDAKAKKISFDPTERLDNSAVYLKPIEEAVSLFGVSKEEVDSFLKKNFNLPHRLEYVGKFMDIDFYNDSAATIPEATIEAINNLKNLKTLIVGGVGKGGDYKIVAEKIRKSNIENLIIFPETGNKIKEYLKKKKENIKIIYCEDMEEAVKSCYKKTSSGSCLLSPASSSFNMFSDYKDRGDKFKKFVKKYGEK